MSSVIPADWAGASIGNLELVTAIVHFMNNLFEYENTYLHVNNLQASIPDGQ